MYLKEDDLKEIVEIFKNLCLNKYRIVFKDQSDESGQTELDLEHLAEGGVNELLKRTLLTAINSVLADKEPIAPKVVSLLALTAPQVESKELVEVKKPSKMSVKGNPIMWETMPKTKQ